ncbi:MAG TPA: hypothetical protein VGR84_14855 [Candidatus Acidoferrales bacterium]|nr:hypothetical protein [Candidatus Acidoferrales bacterium]
MAAQSSLNSRGQTTAQRVSLPPLPPPPATEQEQFLPYWTTEPGWASEIQLRNDQVSQDLTVTPVLRSSNGAETILQPVTIKPHEVVIADVETALASVAPQLIGAYGSVVLRYKAPTETSLFSMAMIRGVGKPIALHIDSSSQLTSYQTGSREGIWWLPASATSDYLILTNEGKSQLLLGLSLYDASGKGFLQQVALAPGAMARYSVRQLVAAGGLSGSYGGITISAAQNAGSLDTLHFLYDRNAGFSALLKMYDHDASTTLAERDFAKTGSWTLHAPMLALSVPDPVLEFPAGTVLQPQLLIRNATAKPLDANLSFEWKRGAQTGVSAGPSLSLGPYQTQNVDVAVLQHSGTVPLDANWAAVKLTTNGTPGDVMAIASSYDKTLKYGAQTPFSDQLAFHWVASVWEYDATHDSIITVGNGGTKPTQAALTLNYDHGTGAYEIDQLLQPDQQMWIDVGQLIRDQVPDKNGTVLPASLTVGSYEIRELTRHVGAPSLFEGKIVYDKKYGNVTYGCGSCCAYKTAKFYFDPLGVPLNGFADQGVEVIDTCSGTWVDITSDFDNTWSTANQSVATVDAYGTHGGVATGTTTTRASTEEQVWYKLNDCPILPMTPQGGDNVNVAPTVTFSSLPGVAIGQTANITATVMPSNNSTPISLTITSSASIVSPTGTFTSSTGVVVKGLTAGTATLTATITNPDGGGTETVGSTTFTVQVPTSLSLSLGSEITYNGTNLIECNGTNDGPHWGYSRCAAFTLLDQNGHQITSGSFTATEVVTTVNSNPPGLQANQGGGALTSGAFQDFWAFTAKAPPPPQPGEFVIVRQNIMITNNSTGTQYPNIRVNCLNFQSTDVTAKDITTSGTCP